MPPTKLPITSYQSSPAASSSRINDLPLDLRPREKLAQLGPSALDHAELMALFISTGTKKLNAIEIGRALLKKYGSISALGGLPVSQLAKEYGLGLAKASKLAAAFELGIRVSREKIRNTPLDSPGLIYQFFAPQLAHLDQEHVVVACTNPRLNHIGTDTISSGTVNESNAHPREILRPVITRAAYGFILIHNHPSGDPSPSRADETVTRRIVEAASIMQIQFLDHVIIGLPSSHRSPYFSFREAGLIP